MEGHIKIHRHLLESSVFASEKRLKIWIWLLCRASYKDRFVPISIGAGQSTVEIKRGQLLFGRFKAEESLNIDGSTIYKALQWMEAEDMIKIQSNSHYTIISICNYDTYQLINDVEVTAEEQPSNNKVTTTEQPRNTYNKVKNIKNSKEDNNIKTWRNDFETYQENLKNEYLRIVTPEYLKRRKTFHPNLDIKKTLSKAIGDYWNTEAGWKNKKAKKTEKIDWERTFNNSISERLNWVYESSSK